MGLDIVHVQRLPQIQSRCLGPAVVAEHRYDLHRPVHPTRDFDISQASAVGSRQAKRRGDPALVQHQPQQVCRQFRSALGDEGREAGHGQVQQNGLPLAEVERRISRTKIRFGQAGSGVVRESDTW